MKRVKAKVGRIALLTIVFFLCEFKECRAQTLEILSDSIFKGIKNNSMETVLRFAPTYNDLRIIFDSVYKDKGDAFVLMKEQRIKVGIRRQFLKLEKNLKSERLDLKKANLQRIVKEEGSDSLGVAYAIVKCRCESGNKRFTISYVALNCGGNWRLADELILEKTED